jgi:hypothetical protein
MAVLTHTAFGTAMLSRLVICGALIAAADVLFFSHDVGWTLGLFCLLVLCSALAFSPSVVRRPSGWVLFGLCVVLCLALIESLNWLTFVLFGLFFAALFTRMRLSERPITWLRKLLVFLFQAAGLAATSDALAIKRHWRDSRGGAFIPGIVSAWFLPATITVVFIMLFASANPVIDGWLQAIDLREIDRLLTLERLMFWSVAGVLIWAALRADLADSPEIAEKPADVACAPSPLAAFLFSREAVTRSLAIANLLFLGQNLLDANFLWGGAALPDGITYAEYAQRGAYPLILTTLLAAAFVLIAMREGGGLGEDRVIRAMIYVWLLQNLALVISSILRTGLYVSQYSLTYLRLAALLWMGLVLAGLVLIVVQIAWSRSSAWLVRANLIATLALLTGTCFFDLGRFIADYNVAHSKEMRGGSVPASALDLGVVALLDDGYFLDLAYLHRIGPSALPAIRRALTTEPQGNPAYLSLVRFRLERLESDLQAQLRAECADWRRWTFRAHRLCREMLPPLALE